MVDTKSRPQPGKIIYIYIYGFFALWPWYLLTNTSFSQEQVGEWLFFSNPRNITHHSGKFLARTCPKHLRLIWSANALDVGSLQMSHISVLERAYHLHWMQGMGVPMQCSMFPRGSRMSFATKTLPNTKTQSGKRDWNYFDQARDHKWCLSTT